MLRPCSQRSLDLFFFHASVCIWIFHILRGKFDKTWSCCHLRFWIHLMSYFLGDHEYRAKMSSRLSWKRKVFLAFFGLWNSEAAQNCVTKYSQNQHRDSSLEWSRLMKQPAHALFFEEIWTYPSTRGLGTFILPTCPPSLPASPIVKTNKYGVLL